jgi:hypothetical protein
MAAVAYGTCGGGEEVSVTLTVPSGELYNAVNETKGLTVTNNGGTEVTIGGEDMAGTSFQKTGSACGLIAAHSSCSTQQVKCLASPAEVKYSILVNAMVAAFKILKCT